MPAKANGQALALHLAISILKETLLGKWPGLRMRTDIRISQYLISLTSYSHEIWHE